MPEKEQTYIIERTQNTTYLDDAQTVVDGYVIRLRLVNFDEVHQLRVPSLDPKTVKAAANKLVAQRAALDDLG